MKHSKLLLAWLACCIGTAAAATYTNLSETQCDETNRVIYDGKGGFAVKSAANTSVKISLNLNSLHSFANSNDYKSGNPMMLWQTNAAEYGLADMADTSQPTGNRAPELCFYWAGKVWQPKQKITYDTLQQYAKDGIVTLKLTSSQKNGITVYAIAADGSEHELLHTAKLKSSKITTTQGYKVNLNYTSAFAIDTDSTLDTAGYTAPADYTAPYKTKRTVGQDSLGRVMFLGDSITHGVNDQTWRWQLFKILVDNSIEAEIVGPRDGYTPGYTNLTTSDAADHYGGQPFPNVHLAQSSGRTHNIISGSNAGMSGVNYGGHSTKSSAATFNCNTWCCLMGTNDLLSDAGYSEADFARKMQNVLGGTVTAKNGKYTRKANNNWGNLGKIAADVLQEDSDVLYIMSVPCWGNHANNNEPDRHLAVQSYNDLLADWCSQYAKKHGKKIVFVEINNGLVDASLPVPFSWPNSMSNKPGRDGLHPNEQGSLIIAGNLAKAMGFGGRTAGLPRQAVNQDWQQAPLANKTKKTKKGRSKLSTLKNGANITVAQDALQADNGFSVQFTVQFKGDAKAGNADHDNGLSLSIGDGTRSGNLHVSPYGLLWNQRVLYCPATDTPAKPIRVTWHPGNTEHNIPQGFYVWYGDMLVGQGLPATEGTHNGISVSVHGTNAQVSPVHWVNTAYAPNAELRAKPSK